MSEGTMDSLALLVSRLPVGARAAARAASVSASARRGSVKKKARQKCKRQVGQCQALVRVQCEGDQECLDRILPCCVLLGTCDFAGFLVCG